VNAASVTGPGSKPGTETPATDARSRKAAQRQSRVAAMLSAGMKPGLVLALIILCWDAAGRLGITNEVIVPGPGDVATQLWKLVQEEFFWRAARVTMTETIAGFLIGAVTAWVVGTLVGMFNTVREAVYPLIVAFQITPRVALAPLFLTWFGFGISSKIVLAATICFFPVLINVVVGLDTVDRDARRLMRSLGASRWDEYRKLSLPSSLPVVFAGLKTAITLALIGAIVAEFVGASEGMGVLISTFNFQLEVASGFAVIVALMLMGLVLYGIIDVMDRKLVYWRQHL
jgi:NitT/TauT family transport system permease protein